MRVDQIKKAAEDFDIKISTAIAIRVRYLQSLLRRWCDFIDIEPEPDEIPESDVWTIITELITLRKYEDRIKQGVKLDSITDEMIQAARSYPIENLIQFTRGKALCFMHPDKTPSLSYHAKTNTCRCFVCDKAVNSIDVMILRDGLSFIDAVKFLS